MKRTFNFLLLAGLLFTNAAFSKPIATPAACPSVASIIVGGLDYAALNPHVGWTLAKLNSKYDTSDDWTFITFVGKSNENATAALEAGIKQLDYLVFSEGPVGSDGSICYYENRLSPSIAGFAVNPPFDQSTIPVKFAQLLQQQFPLTGP